MAVAQNRVRILQADQLIGAGEDKRILRGNVLLQTDDFIMSCDSAYHHQRIEKLEAFGNIEITTDDEKIWADYVLHNLRTEFSEFRGRVILKNPEATIFSEMVDYDHIDDRATFPQYLRLEDENGILVAESGIYYNKADSAVFRGAVQVADSTQYAEADSLFTNRRARYYELHGRVFLKDLERNAIMQGRYVEADSAGFRRIDENAIMIRIEENEERVDTSYVWSHQMLIWEEDTTYRFQAYGDVHIWSERSQSLADSTFYDDAIEKFTLLGELPKAWFRELQLSGPTIHIQMKDEEIESILSYERPFSVQRDTITQRLHQITGDTIFVSFVDGDLDYVRVLKYPELFYHTKDEDDQPDGAIELKTNRYIIMFFEDGEMTKGRAKDSSSGIFHPENEDTKNKRLEGFIYTPELRPEKPEFRMQPFLPEIPEDRPIDLPPRYLRFISEQSN